MRTSRAGWPPLCCGYPYTAETTPIGATRQCTGSCPMRGLLLSSRHREALAASCAAPVQHISTAFGLHAGPKSVGSFTTLIMWLECTLHDNCLRLRRAQIDIRCGAPRQAETRNMVNPEADISNLRNRTQFRGGRWVGSCNPSISWSKSCRFRAGSYSRIGQDPSRQKSSIGSEVRS